MNNNPENLKERINEIKNKIDTKNRDMEILKGSIATMKNQTKLLKEEALIQREEIEYYEKQYNKITKKEQRVDVI